MPVLIPHFEPIDHTADVGYRLFAPTLPQLFEVAGRAMFDAITDLGAIRPVFARTVQVTAADRDALLVRWLAELNFQSQTGRELYCQFEVQSLTENEVTAVVHGEKIDLQRHDMRTEIKAVTYHGLYIREIAGGWEAQVIFDV